MGRMGHLERGPWSEVEVKGGCVEEPGTLESMFKRMGGGQAVDPGGLLCKAKVWGGKRESGCTITFTETSYSAHCSACLGTKLERYGCPRRLTGVAGSPRD